MPRISIPFSGFYESDHNLILENTLEQIFSDHEGRGDSSKNPNPSFDCSLWTDYSRLYCEQFAEAFEYETGFKLHLRFAELVSPRFYNFETDRIFCNISRKTASALFELSAQDNHEKLSAYLEDKFTPRSGWIPFYSPNLSEWLEKPLNEWDHNELGALIACQIDIDSDSFKAWALMEKPSCNGVLDDLVFEALPEDVQNYVNFLDSEQRENAKPYDEIPAFESWLEARNVAA